MNISIPLIKVSKYKLINTKLLEFDTFMYTLQERRMSIERTWNEGSNGASFTQIGVQMTLELYFEERDPIRLDSGSTRAQLGQIGSLGVRLGTAWSTGCSADPVHSGKP